jgi:hypothetical protein
MENVHKDNYLIIKEFICSDGPPIHEEIFSGKQKQVFPLTS